MRLFLALEINEEAKSAALACQEEGKKALSKGTKWVAPTHFHVTLLFLGDKDPELLPSVIEASSEVVTSHDIFQLTLKGMGIFPGMKSPRVLWMGVDQGSQEIIAITRALENKIKSITPVKTNKKIIPHITLGRVKESIDKAALKTLLDRYQGVEFASFNANKAFIMQSILMPEGPVYKPIKNLYLKKDF